METWNGSLVQDIQEGAQYMKGNEGEWRNQYSLGGKHGVTFLNPWNVDYNAANVLLFEMCPNKLY